MRKATKFLTFISFLALFAVTTTNASAQTVINENEANISNDVSSIANTGYNVFDGRGFLSTGDASIYTDIYNRINQNYTYLNDFDRYYFGGWPYYGWY